MWNSSGISKKSRYYVYVHTCPNGKKYVGCTTMKPTHRWNNGKRYWGTFLDDILKYGWDNISHEVFEVESKEEMYRKEIELISFYHSNDPDYGYNLSSGGRYGRAGLSLTPDTKKKISNARKAQEKPLWLFPNGEIRRMTIQNVTRNYLNKGINVVRLKVDEG